MSSLVLASSSVYRAELLNRLQVDFQQVNPAIDESRAPGESVKSLVLRLAEQKASAVALENPSAVVIGSDQVCVFDDHLLGKPGTAEKGRQQLQQFSGNCIEFFTALCVIDKQGQLQTHVDLTTVKFRLLSMLEINRYIEKDQPLDCAGSFKVESLGLSLFESVESKDPSALMGLPLIKLCEFLRSSGFKVP